MKYPVVTMSVVTVALFACGKDSFRGAAGKLSPRVETVAVPCTPNSPNARFEQNVKGVRGTKAKVNGEFCAGEIKKSSAPEYTVLFVTDFSGSMQQADPGCKRKAAALALLDKVIPSQANVEPGKVLPTIRAGAISFDDGARLNVPLKDAAEFRTSSITDLNFCGATGRTNYDAAFQLAKRTLDNVNGQKMVIFVSDGFPSTFGMNAISSTLNSTFSSEEGLEQAAKDKGAQAAAALRALPDLSLYVVYLNGAEAVTTTSAGSAGRSYLDLIAGGADKVRVADSAQDLVTQITSINLPKPAEIADNQVLGTLSIPGKAADRSIPITIKADPSRKDVWTYQSDEFDLLAEVGETVNHTLTVRVQTTTGTSVESVAVLRYFRDK